MKNLFFVKLILLFCLLNCSSSTLAQRKVLDYSRTYCQDINHIILETYRFDQWDLALFISERYKQAATSELMRVSIKIDTFTYQKTDLGYLLSKNQDSTKLILQPDHTLKNVKSHAVYYELSQLEKEFSPIVLMVEDSAIYEEKIAWEIFETIKKCIDAHYVRAVPKSIACGKYGSLAMNQIWVYRFKNFKKCQLLKMRLGY